MKQLFLPGILVIICAQGCSKSNNNNGNNSQPAVSNWNVAGASYQGTTTYWVNATLVSKDSSGDILNIDFYQRPDSNATYFVNGLGPNLNSECFVKFISSTNTFNAAGATGDKVSVSVTGTKIVASFSNITLSYNTGNSDGLVKASGTIIQQ